MLISNIQKLIFIIIATLSFPVSSHHSFAMFDADKAIVLEGTVVKFSFTNPHSYIKFKAPWGPDKKMTVWTLETNAPNYLLQRGWRKDTLKPGDRPSITISPLRNGNPGGSILGVTLEDGTVMEMGGQ